MTTSVDTRLTWDYDVHAPRVLALYEKSKLAQWNATTDIDWSAEVEFGAPLPDDSSYAIAAFNTSPMARFGRPIWDSFRWEFQAWMVSQFLHGEQGALVATARLAEAMPYIEAKYYAASQAGDEARHVEVFSRYLRDNVPDPYPVTPALAALMTDILTDSRWDITALGMQIMVEALAMAAFRLARVSFHDPLIKQITSLVARDEARHVSFGILSLERVYPEMSTAELAEREEFVLEAAWLMRRRFLLEDIWDRLGIDRREGVDFAADSPLMTKYRQTIFAKAVSALMRIGLMTGRVRDGLGKLGLLGYAGASASGATAFPAAPGDLRVRSGG